MTDPDHAHINDQEGSLACEVCLKEIPKSVAQSLEGPDYVHYFCGADCFEKWEDESSKESE